MLPQSEPGDRKMKISALMDWMPTLPESGPGKTESEDECSRQLDADAARKQARREGNEDEDECIHCQHCQRKNQE